MPGRIISFLAPFKSYLFGLAGVIAVAGIGTTLMAYSHIRAQEKTIEAQSGRIGDLVEINRDWAKQAALRDQMREIEHKNALLLQEQLAVIEERSASQSAQLRELEKNNAEVKELLSRRLPADLRKLLNSK